MAKTKSSQAKQCPPVANLKRSAPKTNSSTTPQYATKAPVSNFTVSSRTTANTHASKPIATKKAERSANGVPKPTITPAPRDEVYSTTCPTWSFLQCSPALSLSTSPLPPYEEACVDAPDYERDEGLPLTEPLLGAHPESLPELPAKASTKPESNGIAKTGDPANEKASPPIMLDGLARDILDDINDIMQSLDIDVYAICASI